MRRSSRLILAIFVLLTSPTLAEDASVSQPSNADPEVEIATATFSMYCYWTGEATLGGVDGVVASRIGHWGGDEIVQVDYDPARTDLDTMIAALERRRSFDAVVVESGDARETTRDAIDHKTVIVHRGAPHFIAPKHSLRTRHPDIANLDLAESQAIALNRWSYFGGPMPDVLTRTQQRQLRGEEETP